MDDYVQGSYGLAELFSTIDFTTKTWRDDVTFIIEEKRLYASKAVLAIVSPVFETIFGTDLKTTRMKEVPLPEKKAEDFLEFLNCLYPASKRGVTLENVFQVLPLANEYEVESLLKKCKDVLMKSIADGKTSRRETLKCYCIASKCNFSEVCEICIEKLLDGDNSANFEAEGIMDKDTLLRFKTDIIAKQAKRLKAITTQLVKSTLETSKVDIDGFENADGIIIEHTIDNVFDPMLQNGVFSKPVKLWNVWFSLKISVISDKYLSVFLLCSLPGEKLTCEVRALISLVRNNFKSEEEVSTKFQAPDSLASGYEHFIELSDLLTETTEAIGNYTGNLTVYILAKKPTRIEKYRIV